MGGGHYHYFMHYGELHQLRLYISFSRATDCTIPNHNFNWTMMVRTIGRTDTSKENIENLLSVKQLHFLEQPIDWVYLLDEFLQSLHESHLVDYRFKKEMQFLFSCVACQTCVEALAFKSLGVRAFLVLFKPSTSTTVETTMFTLRENLIKSCSL